MESSITVKRQATILKKSRFAPLQDHPFTSSHSGRLKYPGTYPEQESKIAFSPARPFDGSNNHDVNQVANIWVMNADGSSPTHLTTLTGMGPAAVVGAGRPNQIAFPWRKDGTRIAFTSSRALDGSDTLNTNFMVNIWVMNADGSAQKPVTKVTAIGTDSSEPSWHP